MLYLTIMSHAFRCNESTVSIKDAAFILDLITSIFVVQNNILIVKIPNFNYLFNSILHITNWKL
jgi:hypothetical protein